MHHRPGEPACASCKHQRKKCKEDCMMAPFFPVQNQKQFRAVHKIFGVSNVAKQLKKHNSEEHRRRSADSLIWEATCWENDPIHGPYGEFQRATDELNLYKSQYYKLAAKLPATSQGTTSLMYSQPPAPAPAPAPAPLDMVPHGVLMNNGWNSNCTGAAGTNSNPNNGGIALMDNINGGLLSSVTDYQNGKLNGNLRVDNVVSNIQFHYANTNNNGVVQDLDTKNISGHQIINVPHQPSPSLEQVIQSIGNLQEQRDRPNGAIVLSQRQQQQQHHTMASFNRQFFNPAGQYDSAAQDVEPPKNTADTDSSSLRGGQGTHGFVA